ncbi:MAG: thiamine pyrophosphate-binding protein [Pseudobutyrivibrio sp.]|nr:thiamine pyrophosphate-binding protein [Pseudobutyrivibrio sp.]
MERVADYIIRKINEIGVNKIFLITGRGILYLTDAVARNENVKHVCTYHEQGASYAAMAYALAKGGPATCLVSTGCAATNAVTACLCAYQDNLPVIFLSGNNPLKENTRHTGVKIRTYGSQEADIISVVQGITKYSVMLENMDEVVYEVEKALFLAQEGRRGPVWIDVPLDVQNMRIDEKGQKHFTHPQNDYLCDDVRICLNDEIERINRAERPIILIGGGARNAFEEVRILSEKFGIPVAFSPSACDIYGSSNELSVGAVGSLGGSRAGNFCVQNADYILAIGTKLCSQETGSKESFAREAKVTVVDIDKNEHTKNGINIDKVIYADAKHFLQALLERKIKPASGAWTEKCKEWKKLFSLDNEQFSIELREKNKLDIYSFSELLSKNLSDNATVITDAGFEELIVPATIRFKDTQRCLFPAAQGAMGYAIPAIIGAYEAGREDIACVVGDGSVMMNIQELQTICAMRIPAKVFVINNNMYSVIRKRQRDLFRNRTIGNDPSDGVSQPNFRRIAEGFGIKYLRTSTRSEFIAEISGIMSAKELMIIEVCTDENQVYLHESYAVNDNKKLVRRPIEDMSPFLDRDIIKREMIIPTLEE